MDEKVLVIIPTYNERGNVGRLIPKLFSLPLCLSVLIVDDNSTDGTLEEIEQLSQKYPNVDLIIRKVNSRGLGSSYRDGFQYAVERGYDVVIQMDADLSHLPFYIPKMLELLEKYDLVIGSRYVKGGGIYKWSRLRLLISRVANLLTRILFKMPLNDLTSGFKCMTIDVLRKIDVCMTKSQGYVFQFEMVYRAYMKGLKIAEFPIIFRNRERGKSKMTFLISIEAVLRAIKLYFLGLGKQQ